MQNLLWIWLGYEPSDQRLWMELRTIDENADGRVTLKEWLWYLAQADDCRFDLGLETRFRKHDRAKRGKLNNIDVSRWMFEEVVAGLGGDMVLEPNGRSLLKITVDNLATELVEDLDTDEDGLLSWRDIRSNTDVMANKIEDLTKWSATSQCLPKLRYLAKDKSGNLSIYRIKLTTTLLTRLMPLVTLHCIDLSDAKRLAMETAHTMMSASRAHGGASQSSRHAGLMKCFGEVEEKMVSRARTMRAKRQEEMEKERLEQRRAEKRLAKMRLRLKRQEIMDSKTEESHRVAHTKPRRQSICLKTPAITLTLTGAVDGFGDEDSEKNSDKSQRQSADALLSAPTSASRLRQRRKSACLPVPPTVTDVSSRLTALTSSRRSSMVSATLSPELMQFLASEASSKRRTSVRSVDVEEARRAAAKRAAASGNKTSTDKKKKKKKARNDGNCD